MNGSPSEKEIVRIWQYQLLDAGNLLTEDGEPLQIIHPGWPNDDRGPDFKGAVLVAGRGLVRGDVEIHVRSSSWREHRHHLDPVYNEVILHVVMWRDSGSAAALENGGEAPTLVLGRYANIPVSQWASEERFSDAGAACRGGVSSSDEAVEKFLDNAGDARFLDKAARFQRDLVTMEAGQSLYEGVMGALGYSRNKLPFQELARRVPLSLLEQVAAGDATDAGWISARTALLFGASGLFPVPGQNGCGHSPRGEGTFKMVGLPDVSDPPVAMPSGAWHLLRVRPNNSPVLRLPAMSHLLLRYRSEGLLNGLVRLVREAPLSRSGHKGLEAGLVVAGHGCPDWPYPGVGRGRRGMTLLGSRRAAEIIVNVLLPFTLAWSTSVAQPELGRKATELYRLSPGLSANSVERQMTERLGLGRAPVNSARRQQGLIHVYKSLCSQGKCSSCPMSHPGSPQRT